jgi:hypothetical protein
VLHGATLQDKQREKAKMNEAVNLSNGINGEIWKALAAKAGFTPLQPGVVTAVAKQVAMREPTVNQWFKLRNTDFPVHARSSLCVVALALGVEVPARVNVRNRPWGSNRKENKKPNQLHEPATLVTATPKRGRPRAEDFKSQPVPMQAPTARRGRKMALTIENVKKPAFWMNLDMNLSDIKEAEAAMLTAAQTTHRQAIMVLDAKIAELAKA